MDSPEKILYRLEELRKWQRIQEERLLQRQLADMQELSRYQEGQYEYLNASNSVNHTKDNNDSLNTSNHNTNKKVKVNLECKSTSTHKDEIVENDDAQVYVNIDELPIRPMTNFNVLLENKLKEGDMDQIEDEVINNPKKPFLRKGQGLVRYKMAQNNSDMQKNKKKHVDKNKNCKEKDIANTSNSNCKIKLNFKSDNPIRNVCNTKTRPTWSEILEKEQNCSSNLLKENIYNKDSYSDTSLLESPSLNKLSSEKEKAEQRMFDLIEQKVSNDSFSSTNSFVNKVVSNRSTVMDIYKKLLKLNPMICDSDESSNDNDKPSQNYEKSEGNNWEDVETSESSDTEETCRIIIGKQIMTSTPYDDSKKKIDASKDVHSKNFNVGESQSHILNTDYTNEEQNETVTDKQDLLSIKDMLKERLTELEKEIEVFQSENTALTKLKDNIYKEKEEFLKEKATLEAKLNEDKIISEYHLAEEREKLHKMKLVYDKNMKEMKLVCSKKDREEISNLKSELQDLREQMATKDARNGAAQSRYRNQIKNLEKERSELKEECEKLKKENTKLKSVNNRTQRLKNIKLLGDINKCMSDVEIEDVPYQRQSSSESFKSVNLSKRNKENVKPVVIKHVRSRTRSEPNLTKTNKSVRQERKAEIKRNSDVGFGLHSEDESNNSEESDQKNTPRRNKSKPDIENIYFKKFNSSNEVDDECITKSSKSILKNTSPIYKSNETITMNNSGSKKQHSSEKIIHPDGRVEEKLSNGAVKVTSADDSYTKCTFTNGDVKEILHNEGTINYFFKEMNLRQTIYKDGSEIYHFPDGYIERRYPDGSVKAHLANGTIRWMKPGNCEEWQFPDGTLVFVNSEGEQTLRFPNGQTEVHTSEYKKREFPDGTVKIIYSDGMSETKYASGRIRVKDKYGNLVMDSAQHRSPTKRQL